MLRTPEELEAAQGLQVLEGLRVLLVLRDQQPRELLASRVAEAV
jgi:hypothetical protein